MIEESGIPDPSRIIDRLKLPPGARILALGAADSPITSRLRSTGHSVERNESIPRDGQYDLVVALEVLDREPWGRWALQRIHGRLANGGHLLLSAANTFRPGAFLDPRYVAGKLRKQLAKLTGRPIGAVGARTYTAKQLETMLVDLGFVVEAAPGERSGEAAMFRARHLVLCRRGPSLFGLAPERPFPEARDHRRRFEAAHGSFLSAREAWRRRHPDLGGDEEPRDLDLAALDKRVVLVLSPHPDDELIGCGGTLLGAVAEGARVVVVQATDGSASASLADRAEPERRTVRLREADAVSRAAGFERTICWAEDNRCFIATEERVTQLRALIDELHPAIVLTPFLADAHPDHRTLDRMLARALRAEDSFPILQYEVWGLVPANARCDVTRRMSRLEELLLLYETAMMVDDYVHFCAARDYYHAARFGHASGYFEAFLSTSAARFRALADEPDDSPRVDPGPGSR